MDKLFKYIKIIFESDDYLVLSKPAGIAVHQDGKSDEATLSEWLLEHFPYLENVGEPLLLENGEEVLRPGIVHRIDKETSGILLVAKTTESFEFYKNKFKQREINKTYFAFVYGRPRDERGIIDIPIGRSVSSVRKWDTGKNARGEMREAITKYKMLATKEGVSLLEVWPMTGRTHQIRVHLKTIGHPIIADKLYAPAKKTALGFSRLALHARRLIFKDQYGKEKLFEADFPDDFKTASKSLSFDLPK